MPRLLGPLLLLLPKRRLVNQEVRPCAASTTAAHGGCSRNTTSRPGRFGPTIPSALTFRPSASSTVSPRCTFPTSALQEHRPPALCRIKPPGRSCSLSAYPTDPPPCSVRRRECRTHHVARCPLHVARQRRRASARGFDFERDSLDAELNRLAKYLPSRPWARRGASARRAPVTRASASARSPEKMIGVKVREEDLRQGKAHP